MVYSWKDWYMANNILGAPTKWDPEHNPTHMVRSEVSDVYKAMSKIRALENRLKNSKLSGETNDDWNLLNSLKREVGIPVEFGDDKPALKGEGDIPSKAVTAFGEAYNGF